MLRDLETRFRLSRDDGERAIIADVLVPLYIPRGDYIAANDVLASVPDPPDTDLRLRLAALRAMIAAVEGQDPEALLPARVLERDDIRESSRAVIEQRSAYAFFFARDAVRAEQHATNAMVLAEARGERRAAAGAAGMLYVIHYHLTGDLEAARYYAELATMQSAAAQDVQWRHHYLTAQYDLAAVFGEWERVTSLAELLRRESVHVAEQLAFWVASALLHGARGDFGAMHATVDSVLKTIPIEKQADRALLTALDALALAAAERDDEAKTMSRRAIHLSSGLGTPKEMAFLLIRRRLAAVLGSFALAIVGDSYRGVRALSVRQKWDGSIGFLARALTDLHVTGSIDMSSPEIRSVRGYAIVAANARTARESRIAVVRTSALGALTANELLLLKAVSEGKTNVQIAKDRNVSLTVTRKTLSRVYSKLGVRNRTEAAAMLLSART